MLPPLVGAFDRLAEAFRKGGGVPQSAFDEDLWEGMERFSAVWFENHLIPRWIPAMPEVKKKLRAGADVADVGCGRGRALIKLALRFPDSRYDGFDSLGHSIALARKNARVSGVADRVRFDWRDASEGLPSRYDVITTFDVLHEVVRPKTLLRRIHEALKPDGIYVCVEANCSENLEENAGPLGALRYAFSVLYCRTTSLAAGGKGLGGMGLPEPMLRELCVDVGFASVRRVPIEDPFQCPLRDPTMRIQQDWFPTRGLILNRQSFNPSMPRGAREGGADPARGRAAGHIPAGDGSLERQALQEGTQLGSLSGGGFAQVRRGLRGFAGPSGHALVRGAERDSPADELFGDVGREHRGIERGALGGRPQREA
jgi:2-polyprenyl-3-methyl-5-hydroxy-6-metoxy-1,4-benzoquinol methylase